MSSFFDNFMGGLAFGMLASNPFFRGMGGFGYGCGCGYGGVGGFILGGMYNAVNLTGFANPFPSIFGGGYMGGGYASSAGLVMPTTFANAQFPTIDFSGPMQTIWDMYTNPNSDYNKQMFDWFQKMNNQQNPFSRTDKDKTDTERSSNHKESNTSNASSETEKSKNQDKTNSKSTNVVKTTAKHWSKMTDAEMKEVYGNYTESITTKYTGTAEDLNKVLKGSGVLEGKGQAFIDAQNKYGISAAALAAITMNESGHGKSPLAKKNNNVGGVRIAGSTEFRKFSSVEECIMEMARFLKSGYVDQGITKLYQVNAKYCPASDPTDKDNLNAKWASIVSSNLHKIDNMA